MDLSQQFNFRNTNLVNVDSIKFITGMDENIETQMASAIIAMIQDTFIQEAIGTNLYFEMQKQVFENNLTQAMAFLLDNYMKQAISFYVAAEIMLPLSFKIKAAGVVQQNDDYKTSTSLKDIQAVSQFYKEKAEFFVQRMITFLIEHNSDFPQYLAPRNISDMPGQTTGYYSGTNIPMNGGAPYKFKNRLEDY